VPTPLPPYKVWHIANELPLVPIHRYRFAIGKEALCDTPSVSLPKGDGTMIDHILVPLDGSSLAERVLPHLFALARPFDSRVTLLRVISRTDSIQPLQRIDPLDWQMREAEARSYLNKLTIKLTKTGLKVRNELMYGDPATLIVEFVRNNNIDLLMLSSHGRSGLTGWNISSVVQKTVIRVQKPIMIVRAYHQSLDDQSEARYKKLLIPLDGSPRAECALPLVASLANFHDAQVVLTHVVRKPELPRRAPPSYEESQLANQLIDKNQKAACRYLEDLQDHFPVRMKTHLFVGDDVADTLHSVVDQEKPDLVVISAHGYSGSTQRPYGSLALNFIAYGTTPLLIVQDMPNSYTVLPTPAELASKEYPGH
jgi:nucleotide-binding universal stress UspA family protein